MDARLSGLDALRGIAALIVVIFHGTQHFHDESLPVAGYLAVDFFFMLSGYIMARAYEGRFDDGLTPAAFMRLRWNRVWGTLAIGTVLGFGLIVLSRPEYPYPVLALGLGLLFLPAPFTNALYPLNGPAWSIFFELFANAAHALSLRRLSTPAIWVVALCALAMTAYLSAGQGGFPGAVRKQSFLICFFRVLGPYAGGIILYRVLRDRRIVRPTPMLLFFALPLLIVAGGAVEQTAFGVLFVAVVCPVLIVIGLSTETSIGSFLGRVSFPLYATHDPLLRIIREMGGTFEMGFIAALAFGVVLARRWPPILPRGKAALGTANAPV